MRGGPSQDHITLVNTGLMSHDWGPWHLNGDLAVLYVEAENGYRYEVDLEWCLTSPETLDWIAQIRGKTWCDDACLAGLVRALDDVLRLQVHLCGSGRPRSITKAKARRLAARR